MADEKIDPPLLAQLDAAGVLPVAILLESQYLLGPDGLEDFASENAGRPRSALRSEVVRTLKEAATAEQAVVLEALGAPADARRLWISNAVFVSLNAEQIRAAAAHDLVRYIYLMPRAPASFDSPGTVSAVLAPGARPPFSAEGRRIPWNVERIGASRVWGEFGVTGEGVVVAMIDNGTNYTHPDLASNMWTNRDEVANNGVDDDGNGLIDDYYGFNFNSGVAEVQMNPALGGGAGHGTWTSGIVLGDGTGGVVTGLAPRAQLMVAVVGGDTYSMGSALQFALEQGADVATMSFSLPDLGNVRGLWRVMADHSVAAGLVMVSGAGNFQQSAPTGVQQRIPASNVSTPTTSCDRSTARPNPSSSASIPTQRSHPANPSPLAHSVAQPAPRPPADTPAPLSLTAIPYAKQVRDNKTVARQVRVAPATVGKWRRRFLERRVAGLLDEPRPGAPRQITDAQIEDVIVRTLESTPRGATHWSTREMARATGMSAMGISRIWRVRPAAAPNGDVQAFARSAAHREGPRHRGPVSAATHPRRGLLR